MKIANLFKKTEPPKERAMIEIQMENGSVEKYPENFVVDDGYCVACGTMYHTHLDCPVFKREREIHHPLKAMKRYNADANGLDHCWQCKQYEEES